MNKREEQRKIREQKQHAAQQRSARQKLIAKAATTLLVPLVLIAVVYGIMSQGPVYSPVEIADVDHSRGSNEGVKMVIYADFQCPACAQEHQVVAQAWNVISSRTLMVFRHYPLTGTHAHAWEAATYAEAAGMQGKFWEMYDLLFMNQAYWSTLGNVEEEFDGYLRQLGLDVEQAHRDLGSDDLIQKIRNDQRGGTRAGVRSTPTMFLDGRLVATPQSAVELISMINEAAGR
ncbi:MAG: thioredoxin domain-containing protein [Pseudomonadales bacterium]|nr:thioredoxin domain-containing protein [Pseudomonadales bacterium]MCP5358547.1 thioredoxin domain-containing protein [Pseudomonadales bacterium]